MYDVFILYLVLQMSIYTVFFLFFFFGGGVLKLSGGGIKT